MLWPKGSGLGIEISGPKATNSQDVHLAFRPSQACKPLSLDRVWTTMSPVESSTKAWMSSIANLKGNDQFVKGDFMKLLEQFGKNFFNAGTHQLVPILLKH
jgi:hypothetical protein